MSRRLPSSAICCCSLLFLLAGCGFVKVSGTAFRVQRADAGHSVAQFVRESLESGAAFEADFLIPYDGASPLTGEQLQEFTEEMLLTAQTQFPQGTAFAFLDGVEFQVAGIGQRVVAFPMQGETAAEPSRFRLPGAEAHQVYLIFNAASQAGMRMNIHLLMCKVGELWKAKRVTILPSNMGGKTLEELAAAAASFESAGDSFASFAITSMASHMTSGVNYRDTPVKRSLHGLTGRLKGKLGLPEQPLETFETALGSFQVAQANTRSFAEGPFLELHDKTAELAPPDAMRARQRAIAAACLKKHARLSEFFKGIAVSTLSDSGRGFRSKFAMDEFAMPDA